MEPTPPRAVELLPQLDDLSPRLFEARLATSSLGERDIAVRSCPSASPDAVLASVQVLAPPGTESSPERSANRRSERLEALWSLVIRRGLISADQVRAILRESVRGMRLTGGFARAHLRQRTARHAAT